MELLFLCSLNSFCITLWNTSLPFQVCQYAKDQFLDGLCLQHLLGQLAGDNLSLYFKDYTDQVMDGEFWKRKMPLLCSAVLVIDWLLFVFVQFFVKSSLRS